MGKKIFHGGCISCVMQEERGVAYCTGCQYFEADWSKPDLSRTKPDPLKSVKLRAKIVSKILHFLFGI